MLYSTMNYKRSCPKTQVFEVFVDGALVGEHPERKWVPKVMPKRAAGESHGSKEWGESSWGKFYGAVH